LLALVSALLVTLGTTGVAAASPDLGSPAGSARASRGYDISWPQCGGPYPGSPAFGIVGVNKGIVFSANPCLGSEIAWAGGTAAQLYANTGNPGPELSSHWPTGQASPRTCSASNPDTADCAYDYGWNAAADSYADAMTAWSGLRLPGSAAASRWWLDVETGNSWRADTSLNVAALSGAVASLQSVGVTRLGFYSTTTQWTTITGGTSVFAADPSWGAGSPSLKVAQSHCASTPGFTGGRLALVQYPYQGFDADLVC
ncbi:MAG TPA: hypothetical protein VET90_04205, partial [Candidatus Binatus sp.]|nr:hypothetical protein [Candidatus Binatus sp.]